MNREIFDALYEVWQKKDIKDKFWTDDLALLYGYPSPEALRSAFRRARKRYKTDNFNYHKPVNKKIFIFDLETSPLIAYTFSYFGAYLSPDSVMQTPYILTWAGKYLYDNEIYGFRLNSDEALEGNDLSIIKNLIEIISEADILVGYNLKNFDMKILNTRLIENGLKPLPPKQIVDVYQEIKKTFYFHSNSMKYVAKVLKVHQKIENEGIGLWKRCMNGDEDALIEMLDYCKGDILATEDIYIKILPFISHPNMGVFNQDSIRVCPNCGSSDIYQKGKYYTPAGEWLTYYCNSCGAFSRGKQNLLDKSKKKMLLIK
ncbi:MAG: hypothetical protein KatS3mg002_1066 [Candidatus Woesearchaeota archaeon]|jgi:hypothetical protein|nr:MAG: hypothetical protein KatS3mg002_1066 [Candidatus Woesearchaeota archaeon]